MIDIQKNHGVTKTRSFTVLLPAALSPWFKLELTI
jgi:hypothetical protein